MFRTTSQVGVIGAVAVYASAGVLPAIARSAEKRIHLACLLLDSCLMDARCYTYLLSLSLIMDVCMYVCMYVHTYIYVYVCIYIYIHIYTYRYGKQCNPIHSIPIIDTQINATICNMCLYIYTYTCSGIKIHTDLHVQHMCNKLQHQQITLLRETQQNKSYLLPIPYCILPLPISYN